MQPINNNAMTEMSLPPERIQAEPMERMGNKIGHHLL